MTNLTLSKSFDTLIKLEDGILLCKHSDVYDGVYGSSLCDWDILIKDDNGILQHPNEQLNYSEAWLDDMYERVEPGDEDDDTVYMDYEYSDEKIAVRKLQEIPSDIKQTFVDVEHGINTDKISVTDADMVRGKVYKAPLYVPQEYPSQEYEDAFMFVGDDGNTLYIKRTSPFFSDEDRDSFKEIKKEEFEEFCD